MSTTFEDVNDSIEEIAQSPENDLLIIRGSWGVGKTYFWENLVKRLRAGGKLALANYAYVSLFGASDIASVRNQMIASVLLNKVSTKKKGLFERSKGLFQSDVLESVKKSTAEIPYVKWLPISLATEAAFMLVQDCVICIDDIERKDEKLNIKQVLGLAAFLKEQKGCKVVFILNQDTLSENERLEFDSYNEKLVNWNFEFAPTPESVFEYVFPPESEDFEFIRDRCLSLEIRNIRILKRIAAHLFRIRPHILGIPESIRLDVIRSIILYVWCEFDRESRRPTFEFLESYISYLFELRKDKLSPDEVAVHDDFNQILDRFGYVQTDDVDRELIQFVSSGVINSTSFSQKLADKIAQQTQHETAERYTKAWDLYRHKFGDNEADFLNELIESFELNITRLGLADLQAVVEVLRHFKRDKDADRLLEDFFKRITTDNVHEWLQYSVSSGITDKEISARIASIGSAVAKHKPSFEDSLQRIAMVTSLSEILSEELEVLAAETSERFYEYFKSYGNDDLYYLVANCLKLEQTKKQTIQALRKISSESEIDALRVKRLYNIGLYDDFASDSETSAG